MKRKPKPRGAKQTPDQAMRIVVLLRTMVKRPSMELHSHEELKTSCRFTNGACPTGLFPKATYKVPWSADSAGLSGILDDDSDDDPWTDFVNWWDSLPLAQATEAVDFIWPRKRRRR